MKEITILSGKGGAGKTSVTAAIASLSKNAVFCDNDVDAADLHLIFDPKIQQSFTFKSGQKATIDPILCTSCGICMKHCRFEAISMSQEGQYEINPFKCEGCRLCERTCPAHAIHSYQNENNHWYISDTRFGVLVHAHMDPGEENSGKLVTEVRRAAKKIATERNAPFVINDGPPGIGCAAISSITGIDLAILVIEPTKSGLHDIERLQQLIDSFNIRRCAIINKSDMNPEMNKLIKVFLQEHNIPLIAELPFDKDFVSAMNEGKSIIEYSPNSNCTEQIAKAWDFLSANKLIVNNIN